MSRLTRPFKAVLPRSPSAFLWTTAGLLAAVAVAGTWYTSPRALLVEEVRFVGNQRATQAELRHLADLPNGTTQLGVSDEDVARRVTQHPWVAQAWVRRTWDSVIITVDEHRPVALAQVDDRLHYLNVDGLPFLPARASDLDYPIIAGLDASVRSLHPALGAAVLRDATALLEQADSRGLVGLNDVSEVVFTPTRGFTVHLRGGAEVLFGLTGHARQLDRLAILLDSGVSLSAPTWVDLGPERVAIVRDIHPLGEG